MSDAPDLPTARRSGRDRKAPIRLQEEPKLKSRRSSTGGRKKRPSYDPDAEEDEDDASAPNHDADAEPDEDEPSEPEEDSGPEQDPESDEEFDAPKSTKRRPRASGGKGKGVRAKKPAAGGVATRAPRKGKKANGAEGPLGEVGGEEAALVKGGAKDVVVNQDNTLYNAVRNPDTALQTVVDDWIESYQTDAGPAMAELINFVLRSCGCNSTIDEHQAQDENGIVDVLDGIQDDFKKAALLAYPLVSKSKPLKKFRASLMSFLARLFTSAAASEVLYDETFCQLFQSWLVSLSSSKVRSFRHTATVFALATVSALCEVAVAVNQEFSQASRAKEAEEKKGRKDKARLKDLSKNVKEVHARKTRLEEYLTELFDTVFVHRYRDSEPLIRCECIKALGSWMKIYPDYWLEGNYLRYIGWVLSDEHKDVRHESVKALTALYAKDDHISAMQHFTDRFKAHLVRMATGEIDLPVRITCIHVLHQIDKHGLLEPEQADQIAVLVFEEEKRVRQAVAAFFAGLLDEAVQERATQADVDETDDKLPLKCLAELLVKYGRALDGVEPENDESGDGSQGTPDDVAHADAVEHVKWHRGRVAFAVDALWDQAPVVRDWQGIINFLLFDHSIESEGTPKSKQKSKTKAKSKKVENDQLDPACRLTEEEETLLVEVLVASLGKVTTVGSAKKERENGHDEEVQAEVSRAVIDALPRLFVKHQIVPSRMIDILTIPTLISLDVYLDMREVTAYEALWDDVQKQFMNQSDPRVIDQAIKTIGAFLATTVLSNTNKTKMLELEANLVTSLRDAVADKDIEASAFEEDELLVLASAVTRINKLYAAVDLSTTLDDKDEGLYSSGWEILDSLVARGRLGYRDEAVMVEQALSALSHHLFWRFVELLQAPGDVPDAAEVASIVTQRDTFLERLEEFSVGTNANAVERVKQTSLSLLLEIFILSDSISSPVADPNGKFSEFKLKCSDELQARCAGFIEAEIERYSEALTELADGPQDQDNSDDDGESTGDERTALRKKTTTKKSATLPNAKSLRTPAQIRAFNAKQEARLIAAGQFDGTMNAFVRAIHAGIVDLRHASIVLTHYDRFGQTFDQYAKILVQDLRDEGMYGNNADEVARIIVESLKGACDLALNEDSSTEEQLLALSRLLVGAVVVRGAQLAVIKRLPIEQHLQIHVDVAVYALQKLQTFEEANKKDARNKVLVLFKALANLLVGIDGKSSLKLKTKLDALLEASKIDVPAAAKAWEPLRAYQKRLITVMAKDPSIKSAATKKAKAMADAGSDGETDSEAVPDRAAVQASLPALRKSHVRPRRISATKNAQEDAQDSGTEDEEVVPTRRTARAKRGTPTIDAMSPKRRKMTSSPALAVEEPNDSDEGAEIESFLLSATQSRKKRTRSIASDDDAGGQPIDQEMAADATPVPMSDRPRPPDSQASLADIRHKKTRKARR